MSLGRLAVFGLGYVLGARAGRGRYESIKVAASKLSERLETYAADGSASPRRTDDG